MRVEGVQLSKLFWRASLDIRELSRIDTVNPGENATNHRGYVTKRVC